MSFFNEPNLIQTLCKYKYYTKWLDHDEYKEHFKIKDPSSVTTIIVFKWECYIETVLIQISDIHIIILFIFHKIYDDIYPS